MLPVPCCAARPLAFFRLPLFPSLWSAHGQSADGRTAARPSRRLSAPACAPFSPGPQVRAGDRPLNSALEVDIDFEHAQARPNPKN